MICAILAPDQAHGFAAARIAPAGATILHTSQVFPESSGGLKEQVSDGLSQIARLCGGLDQILRLHAAVAPGVNKIEVIELLHKSFPDETKRPTLTLVESRIEKPGVRIAFDAVSLGVKAEAVSGQSAVLEAGGRIDIAGQAEKADGTMAGATKATLESLEKTLKFLGSDLSKVVLVKGFVKSISEAETVRKVTSEYFGGKKPPLVLVEWTMALPIEIEMVASTGDQTPTGHRYLTPPVMTPSPL